MPMLPPSTPTKNDPPIRRVSGCSTNPLAMPATTEGDSAAAATTPMPQSFGMEDAMEVCTLTSSPEMEPSKYQECTPPRTIQTTHQEHMLNRITHNEEELVLPNIQSPEAQRTHQRIPSITELDRLQRQRREEKERSKAQDFLSHVDHVLNAYQEEDEAPNRPSAPRFRVGNHPPAPRLRIRPHRSRSTETPVYIPHENSLRRRPSLRSLFPSPDSNRFVLQFPNGQNGDDEGCLDLRPSMDDEEESILVCPKPKVRLQPKRRRTFSMEQDLPFMESASVSTNSSSTDEENDFLHLDMPSIGGDSAPRPRDSNPFVGLMPFPSPPRNSFDKDAFHLQPKKPRLIHQKEELDVLMELQPSHSSSQLQTPHASQVELAKEAAFRFGRSESVETIQAALSPSAWSESNFRTPTLRSRKGVIGPEERAGLLLPRLFSSTSEEDLASSYTNPFQRSSSILNFLKDRFSPSRSKFKTPSRS